jgi:hypothetical protein
MKQIIAVLALLVGIPVLADVIRGPDVRFDFTGTFDANRVFSGTFTASGGVNEVGTAVDDHRFSGDAIHITRLLTTSHGDYITIQINTNHAAGSNAAPPAWCPAPPTPAGTTLFFEVGNWRVVSGTGVYALLNGTGDRAAWYILEGTGAPLAATECLIGQVQSVH